MLKTYKNWKGSLNSYLQIGDKVDEEMYEYFINVMPPVTFNSKMVQMGEPYSSSREGKPTYLTLEKIDNEWIYKGTCHAGDNKHQKSIY